MCVCAVFPVLAFLMLYTLPAMTSSPYLHFNFNFIFPFTTNSDHLSLTSTTGPGYNLVQSISP